MNKKLTILTILLLLVALLTACSASQPTQSSGEDSSLPKETIPIEPEEESGVPEEETSIESKDADTLEEKTSIEPGEESGEPGEPPSPANGEVSWAEALEVLNSGEVKLVSQTHDLQVSLVLNDGRTIKTISPSIDAIFQAIRECGDACSNIVQMTE